MKRSTYPVRHDHHSRNMRPAPVILVIDSTAVTQPFEWSLSDALAVWDRFMASGGAS